MVGRPFLGLQAVGAMPLPLAARFNSPPSLFPHEHNCQGASYPASLEIFLPRLPSFLPTLTPPLPPAHGASRLVYALSARLVKTRRAPSVPAL